MSLGRNAKNVTGSPYLCKSNQVYSFRYGRFLSQKKKRKGWYRPGTQGIDKVMYQPLWHIVYLKKASYCLCCSLFSIQFCWYNHFFLFAFSAVSLYHALLLVVLLLLIFNSIFISVNENGFEFRSVTSSRYNSIVSELYQPDAHRADAYSDSALHFIVHNYHFKTSHSESI